MATTNENLATIEDLERELWLRRRNNSEILWKTKDDKLIPINQMSDSHIINSIKMIEKINEFRDIALEYDAFISSHGF